MVFINDKELTEDAYIEDLSTQEAASLILGEDEYYVLGDNRVVSYDSRRFQRRAEKIYYRQSLVSWLAT